MLQISLKLIWHIIVLEFENSTKNLFTCKSLPCLQKVSASLLFPLQGVLIASAIRFSPSHYEDYQFEQWAQNCGWGLVALPLVFLFGTAFIQILRYKVYSFFYLDVNKCLQYYSLFMNCTRITLKRNLSQLPIAKECCRVLWFKLTERSIYWLIEWLIDWFTQGLRNATTPHDNWGPALEENRKGRYVVGQENKGFEAEEKETKLGDDIEIKKNGNSNGSSITVQF